jgi:predicted NBD/HSP70 family sugar kinase
MSRPRNANRRRVVDALRHEGAASRMDLVRVTDLSRTTVTALVDELLAQGLVVEQPSNGELARNVGRPPMLLRLNSRAGAAVGVAIGRRAARVAVADLSGTVLTERQIEVDSPIEGLDAVPSLVEAAREASGVPHERIIGAGVALPGPIDWRTGRPRTSVLLAIPPERNPKEELQGRLDMPVRVDNDANLEALAERAFGAGRGVDDLVYVDVGEGIGAGIVLSGRLNHGVSGLAGEIGHIQAEPSGSLCLCGNRGCLGTIAAAGPLLRVLSTTHGRDLGIDDLLALVAAGDAGACRIVDDAGYAIGRVLAQVANVLNPARIVVGGVLSQAGDTLIAGISHAIDRHAQPSVAQDVTVVAAELGARAAVLGALLVVIQDTYGLPSRRIDALGG